MQHLLNSAKVISSKGMLRHMRVASHALLHTGGGSFACFSRVSWKEPATIQDRKKSQLCPSTDKTLACLAMQKNNCIPMHLYLDLYYYYYFLHRMCECTCLSCIDHVVALVVIRGRRRWWGGVYIVYRECRQSQAQVHAAENKGP